MALTDEQKELRRNTIGASEVAAVCGESPWESPLDVYIRKVEGVEKEPTEAMRRGEAFEPVIAELYEQEHLKGVERLVGGLETFIHPTVTWASATPDRKVVRHLTSETDEILRLVELKRTNWRLAHRWQDGEAPQENILQAAWQMGVCDVDICDLFALIGGDELVLVRIERDRELEAMLFEIVEKFVVNHWRKGIPPDPGKSEAAKAALVRLYPKHLRPDLLPAAPLIDTAAFRLARFKWLLKQVEGGVTEQENIIKAYVCDAAGVEGEGWRCTWKATKDTEKVDWKAVAHELWGDKPIDGPLVAAIHKHTATKPGPRRFLFKEKTRGEHREITSTELEKLACGVQAEDGVESSGADES